MLSVRGYGISTGGYPSAYLKAMVHSDRAGGDQVFTITHEGKIIDVEYGE